jgi:magnesium transporter
MLKKYQISNGRITESADNAGPVEVYIKLTDNEKRFLIDVLKLDEHTLDSATDPDEQSRLEFEPEHIAMILKIPKNYSAKDQFMFRVGSMGLYLFKERLIIILSEDIQLFVGKHFNKLSSHVQVCLRLIYTVINHFNEHLKIINMVSESLESKINTSMENRYLLNLFTLEKSLVYYLNSINFNTILLEKLKLNVNKVGFTQEQIEYLEDIIIENNQCYRQAEIYSNILASMMDARVSIVSNNLNILMKTLNIITIAIMVPTFVVSAFSMNVKIPIQDHPFAFWIILGMAMVSVIGFMLYWKRKKW